MIYNFSENIHNNRLADDLHNINRGRVRNVRMINIGLGYRVDLLRNYEIFSFARRQLSKNDIRNPSVPVSMERWNGSAYFGFSASFFSPKIQLNLSDYIVIIIAWFYIHFTYTCY